MTENLQFHEEYPRLDMLLKIQQDKDVIFTRAGAYSPTLNIWIADDLSRDIQTASAERRHLLEAYAAMAIAAGAIHRQQLADNEKGLIWPLQWIKNRDGRQLVAFCRENPLAANPYCCVNDSGEIIPYSQAYRDHLEGFLVGLGQALISNDISAQQQLPYFQALQTAFSFDTARKSDLAMMNDVDVAWVKTPKDIEILLLAEFTESYSDPLQQWVAEQPYVTAWAQEIADQTGLGPWKVYFEARVFDQSDEVLSSSEIEAIRVNNASLYREITKEQPSTNASTEFRRVLIVAGHGANPPKSAKNYPNQNWIRESVGYRNIVFANQAEAIVRDEIVPALRAAFATDWAQSKDLFDVAYRTRALFLVGHEETHPWASFPEVSWMEEFKSDVLGLWSIATAPQIKDDLADILISTVGGILLLHRHHQFLLERGDTQFQDYHVGDTIFLSHLLYSGFLVQDENGIVFDVDRSKARPALESLAKRIINVKKGSDSILSFKNSLYNDARIFNHFVGWKEHQNYFEKIWGSR